MQNRKSTKTQAGFDQDMTNSEELADMPAQGSAAMGGRRSRTSTGSRPASHNPRGNRGGPRGTQYGSAVHRTTRRNELVTIAEEQQGHLPTLGNPLDIYTTETYHVPLCSTDEMSATDWTPTSMTNT
eukprot:6701318-Pyramimonas_sp.AAC.1